MFAPNLWSLKPVKDMSYGEFREEAGKLVAETNAHYMVARISSDNGAIAFHLYADDMLRDCIIVYAETLRGGIEAMRKKVAEELPKRRAKAIAEAEQKLLELRAAP